jgi:ankyrin repeat protein
LERLPKYSTPYLDAIDKYGNTPLHLAFLNSNIDILRELSARKPNFKIKNYDEMTPMDYGLNS